MKPHTGAKSVFRPAYRLYSGAFGGWSMTIFLRWMKTSSPKKVFWICPPDLRRTGKTGRVDAGRFCQDVSRTMKQQTGSSITGPAGARKKPDWWVKRAAYIDDYKTACKYLSITTARRMLSSVLGWYETLPGNSLMISGYNGLWADGFFL